MITIIFLNLSIRRIINVFIAQGFVFALSIFLVYKILKYKKTEILIVFSGYYISIAIGLFLNFIYVFLTNVIVIKILNFLTNYFTVLSSGFLTLFCLTLLKGRSVITPIKKILYLMILGILLFFMLLIPNGIKIGPETNWLPYWRPSVFFYAIAIMTIITTIPFYYSSIRLYYRFKEKELKKKWSYFIIGTSMLYFILYGTFISHLIFNRTFYLVFSPIKLIFAILGTLLSYYGVIKQF